MNEHDPNAAHAIPSEDLFAFFQNEVIEVAKDTSTTVPADTQIYLANLLVRFARTEGLFVQQDGELEREPLALLLRKALEQEDAARLRTMARLGDVALYTSGFLAEDIESRGLDLSYYIQMGGMAYNSAAELANRRARASTFHPLYSRLAEHFRDLVRVLWTLADRARSLSPADLVRLYRRWERTGSERLAHRLTRNGILLAAPAEPARC